MTALTQLRVALRNWEADGIPTDFEPIADAARAYADLLENGRRVTWCETHGSSSPFGAAFRGRCWLKEIDAKTGEHEGACRIVSRLLIEVPE
jgi:hypothetical protein